MTGINQNLNNLMGYKNLLNHANKNCSDLNGDGKVDDDDKKFLEQVNNSLGLTGDNQIKLDGKKLTMNDAAKKQLQDKAKDLESQDDNFDIWGAKNKKDGKIDFNDLLVVCNGINIAKDKKLILYKF